jgi:hypothetical protein
LKHLVLSGRYERNEADNRLGLFTLTAINGLNRYYREAVCFGGVYSTARSAGTIEFDLPSKVESRDQCVALLSYYLKRQLGSEIPKIKKPDWFDQGLAQKHLLPWLQNSKPKCESEAGRESNMKYTVFIDDNFHYMDESYRCKHGDFETGEEALEAAKRIVDESLASLHTEGMTASKLYDHYVTFGDDPFIIPEDESCKFSACIMRRK